MKTLTAADIIALLIEHPAAEALYKGHLNGYTHVEALAALGEYVRQYTDDQDDIDLIVEGSALAMGFDPQPLKIRIDATGPPITDIANAERFITHHGKNVRYVYQWHQWLAWDGTRWANDPAHIERKCKATVQTIWDEVKRADGEKQKQLIRWAIQSASEHHLFAMAKVARSTESIVVTPDQLDKDDWLLNTPNGTIDLHTGELRAHDRDDYITKMTATVYDPQAECPLWDKFLAEVLHDDPELVTYVQRLIGYSLTGEVTEHSFHILYGTGRNGKGVFTNTVIKMLGDYGGITDPETFLARKDAAHPTNLADLHGKRLVGSSETDAGRRLNEATVKNLTGGDIVKARRMREDFWSYEPSATMLLSTNNLPAVHGTDIGIWSRLQVIPFTVTIPPERQDHDLERKLRDEWPGILRWAVDGCVGYQRDGRLVAPEAVRIATSGYRADMDSVGRFVAEKCELRAGAREETSLIIHTYNAWCAGESEEPVNAKMFGKRLVALGTEAIKSNGTRYHTGIRLIQVQQGHVGTKDLYDAYEQPLI